MKADQSGHPAALDLWAILRDRSVADRQLVLQAVRRRNEHPTTANQAIALEAGRRYVAARGCIPSCGKYEAFRDEQPDRSSWPSGQLIRNAFGDWPKFRAALSEVEGVVDVLARRLVSQGVACDVDNLRKALRHWGQRVAPKHEPLIQDDFKHWCRDMNRRDDSPFGLLPVSTNTIAKHLGPWPDALTDAGFGDRIRGCAAAAPAAGLTAAAELDPRLDLDTMPTAPPGPFTPTVAAAWLRWAASGLSEQQLREWGEGGYMAVRADVARHLGKRPEQLRIPSATTIIKRLGGSWLHALLTAGLIDAHQAAVRAHPGPYSVEQLIDDVAAAMLATNAAARLTEAKYDQWRDKVLATRRLADPRARVASAGLLRQRLGGAGHSWALVKEEVFLVRPELKQLDQLEAVPA